MHKEKLVVMAAVVCFSFGSSFFYSDNTLADESSTPIAEKVAESFNLIGADDLTESAEMTVIQRPGASFIKVHFKNFQVPEGVFVEVSNPEGTEVFRYGQTLRSPYTFDVNAGEDGTSSFSSMSIKGDTVQIKMLSNGINLDPKQHNVDIDYFIQGYPEQQIKELLLNPTESLSGGAQLESTCGSNERKDAVCFESSNPVEFERTRPVARLLVNGNSLCTAWRVSADNRMFTNNHCVESQADVRNTEVWFNFQNTRCGGSETAAVTKVTGNSLLKTDFNFDYTLFTVNDFASIESFGFFGLDPRVPEQGEEIFIPQHGAGNPMELAISSDRNAGGVCQVDEPSTAGRTQDSDIGYFCDTVGGSSGSPVVSKDSNKVVAIHHFGGCLNQGVQIAKIWPQVSSFFADLPDNDNGDTLALVKDEPTANFSFTRSGLSTRFFNTSKDNGSVIETVSWAFGDGETSTAKAPIHVYPSEGTYTATLTVTDKGGLTDSVSKQIIAVEDAVDEITELNIGETLENLSASEREFIFFRLQVPAGEEIHVEVFGGSGDVDIYTRAGDLPSTSIYDCRPFTNANDESCTFTSVGASEYFIGLRAYSGFNGVSLRTRTSGGNATQLNSLADLSSQKGQWQVFSINVEPGASALEVAIAGAAEQGDADLYVNPVSEPSTSVYACRPFKNDSNERCVIDRPSPGVWFVGVRAYSVYSGVSLTINVR